MRHRDKCPKRAKLVCSVLGGGRSTLYSLAEMNGWWNRFRAVPQNHMQHSLSGTSICCGRVARRGLLFHGSEKGFRMFQPAGSIAVCTTVVFALGRSFLGAISKPWSSQTPLSLQNFLFFVFHANGNSVEHATSALSLSFFDKTPSNNCMMSSLNFQASVCFAKNDPIRGVTCLVGVSSLLVSAGKNCFSLERSSSVGKSHTVKK